MGKHLSPRTVNRRVDAMGNGDHVFSCPKTAGGKRWRQVWDVHRLNFVWKRPTYKTDAQTIQQLAEVIVQHREQFNDPGWSGNRGWYKQQRAFKRAIRRAAKEG